MSDKPSFFSELRRRNVYKVAVAYVVGGWALSQGVAQVFPVFNVPNWVIQLLVVMIVMGLPIALVLAWAFEITPQGIKRTETADAMPQAGQQKKNAWIYVVVLGAVVSIGLFFLGRYTASHTTAESPRPPAAAKSAPAKSIAVLPLVNESGDPKDEYFSDGLSEELIAALAQISGLKVIGRSSSFRFKDRKDEPKTIGQKLGVSTLLDGTVRKQGDRVRIVAALVNAADGIQLWTQTFDRQLKDIFDVQKEIAQAVAKSLKVTLLGTDSTSAASATDNAEAHNAYLEGHFYLVRRNVEDLRKAIGRVDSIKKDTEVKKFLGVVRA
jgi:serine/threonine-protein kinase